MESIIMAIVGFVALVFWRVVEGRKVRELETQLRNTEAKLTTEKKRRESERAAIRTEATKVAYNEAKKRFIKRYSHLIDSDKSSDSN